MAQHLIRLELRETPGKKAPNDAVYDDIHRELAHHGIRRLVIARDDRRLFHLPNATYGVATSRTLDQTENTVHMVALRHWEGPIGIVAASIDDLKISGLKPFEGDAPDRPEQIIQGRY